ncbi:hypothetical protein F4810DRAFT_401474 [Camillea tinctor]|nr:hypothetical protein F4810DRAFT_401474 [Camillea tinctor]
MRVVMVVIILFVLHWGPSVLLFQPVRNIVSERERWEMLRGCNLDLTYDKQGRGTVVLRGFPPTTEYVPMRCGFEWLSVAGVMISIPLDVPSPRFPGLRLRLVARLVKRIETTKRKFYPTINRTTR